MDRSKIFTTPSLGLERSQTYELLVTHWVTVELYEDNRSDKSVIFTELSPLISPVFGGGGGVVPPFTVTVTLPLELPPVPVHDNV